MPSRYRSPDVENSTIFMGLVLQRWESRTCRRDVLYTGGVSKTKRRGRTAPILSAKNKRPELSSLGPFVVNGALAVLPSAHDGDISRLPIPRHVQVEARTVPLAVAVQVQEPLACARSEDTDLADAVAIPVA